MELINDYLSYYIVWINSNLLELASTWKGHKFAARSMEQLHKLNSIL